MSAIEIQYIVMNIWFYYPKYSGGQHFCILMCGLGGGVPPKYWEKKILYIQCAVSCLHFWTAGQEKTLFNVYNVRLLESGAESY